jgi:hypothetical protein
MHQRRNNRFFQNHKVLSNFNKDEHYYDYGHSVISVVSKIIKSAPYAINILEHVLSLKPSQNIEKNYLCSEIIHQLIQFSEGYKKINYILQEIIDSGMITEDLNDICDASEQNALRIKEYLGFIPVSATPQLIEDNIKDANQVINNILKKIHTDLSFDDREKLKINLVRDLSALIENNEYIKLILTKTGECARAINIYSSQGGAGYEKNKIDINGSKEYVIDKDKYSIPSSIVHESVHLYIDNLFQNDSEPFKENDLQSLKVWKEMTEKIYTVIVEKAGIYDRITADKFTSIEDNAYKIRTYKEYLRIKEVPAFFIQDIAIRILATKAGEKMKDSILVQQFPEIGNLMQGILCLDNSGDSFSTDISLNGDLFDV